MENKKLIEAYEEVILNEASKGTIILNSKITGTMKGKDLDSPYRAVIFQKNGRWEFALQQSFEGKYTKYSNLPSWRLVDMLDHGDFIYIDAGQKWGAKGIKKAVQEALKHI